MEGLIKKISLSFSKFFPIVRADDSEEEIIDPQVILRSQCQRKECLALFEKLESCNARVTSRKKTSETCDEEMVDFINCLDHCVSKSIFSKLK